MVGLGLAGLALIIGLVIGRISGAAVVAAIGMAVNTLPGRRYRGGRHRAETAEEDARLRADERRLLARELPDVVTHHLSNISLQVMSHLDSIDILELHHVLKQVSRSADSALTELRVLVRVLRDHPATAPGTDQVGELTRHVAPTIAAAAWSRRLTTAGFDPNIDIPSQADRLEMSVQGTITRTLDVVCANIAQHAPPRSWCIVTLRLIPTQVTIFVASPLSTQPAGGDVVLGRGLRGLRERVDLTGGGFRAGPSTVGADESQWVVAVTLPDD